MKKFFVFLAFAVFALVACSEEPQPTHSELCAKNTNSKECLAGRWYLQSVEETNGNRNPNCDHNGNDLKLEANGNFSFNGGHYNIEILGKWNLNETGMEIECLVGDCTNYEPPIPDTINATIKILNSGSELRITSKGYTSFSRCKLDDPTTTLIEVFSWQSNN